MLSVVKAELISTKNVGALLVWIHFFVVQDSHQIILDGFDQLLSLFMHCPHTLSSALRSINLYNIKKFEFFIEFFIHEIFWNAENRTRVGWVRSARYLCAMPTPFPPPLVWISSQRSGWNYFFHSTVQTSGPFPEEPFPCSLKMVTAIILELNVWTMENKNGMKSFFRFL